MASSNLEFNDAGLFGSGQGAVATATNQTVTKNDDCSTWVANVDATTGQTVSAATVNQDGSSTRYAYTDGVVSGALNVDVSGNITSFTQIAADGSKAVIAFDPAGGQTTSATNLNASGQLVSSSQFAYDQNGNQIGTTAFDAASNTTTQSTVDAITGATLTNTAQDGAFTSVFTNADGNTINYAGGIGQALGSALGNALGGNSLAARSVAGSVVGDAAGALANFLSTSGSFSSVLTALDPVTGATSLDQVLSGALSNLGATGAASKTVTDDVDGGLANLLTAEAGQASEGLRRHRLLQHRRQRHDAAREEPRRPDRLSQRADRRDGDEPALRL